jgi:hypothetical protein
MTTVAAGRSISTRAQASVQDVSIGTALTGKTPKKNAHARMRRVLETDRASLDKGEIELVDRWKSCRGTIVYTVNEKGEQGPKRKCFVCGKQTSWKCTGCHENFCAVTKVPEDIETETGKRPPLMLKITFPGSDKVFYARNTCYLHKHQSAFEYAV